MACIKIMANIAHTVTATVTQNVTANVRANVPAIAPVNVKETASVIAHVNAVNVHSID